MNDLLRAAPRALGCVVARAAAGGALLAGAAAYASGPAATGIVASADTAATAADNPAGLTRLATAEAEAEIVGLALDDTDQSSTARGASRSSSSSNTLGIPALYYARPWNERLALGISLTVPSGVGSDPGTATVGRYLLEKWSLGYASLAPAVGYRVTRRFSVGAALNLNYSSYEYKTAVYNGPGQPDGTMRLQGSDFSTGFVLGTLCELTPRTRVGLVYRSATIAHFAETPDVYGLSPARQAIFDAVGLRGRPVNLESRFPQSLLAGAYHAFDNGAALTVDAAWVNFSQFGLTQATVGSASINTDNGRYNNIWAGSVGYRWPLNARWTALVGAAYASSGVTDPNRSFAFRLDRIEGAGVGAEYQWTRERIVSVNVSYFDLGPAPVTVSVPTGASLTARYSSNYAVALNIAVRWLRPGAR